ncbi:MAG: dockerin type I domain-containing protein, partial [Planctomycetota bacterium]
GNGNGIVGHVFVDDQEVRSLSVSEGAAPKSVCFKVTVADGSKVDFAIDPRNSDDNSDSTRFTIRIFQIENEIEFNSNGVVLGGRIQGNLESQLDDANRVPPSSGFTSVSRHADNHQSIQFSCDSNEGALISSDSSISNNFINALIEGTVVSLNNGSISSEVAINVFREESRIELDSSLAVNWLSSVDATESTFNDLNQLIGGTIPVGTFVSSHLFHFDAEDTASITLSGTATFASEILGVVVSSANLNSTDDTLGVNGVIYPFQSGRAWELGANAGAFSISGDGKSIDIVGVSDNLLNQLRIITAASSDNNLDLPYVAADEFIVGADEVSLDNCSSAWYQFTFDMPSSFSNPVLSGIANVDDVAVLWLNGNRISAEVDSNDLGSDRIDQDGLPLLSWPTQDVFQTNQADYFVPGTNVLTFSVIGDLSQFDPTGVEFDATIQFSEATLLGDVNQDGIISLLDVGPFVNLISFSEFQIEADVNQDGNVDLQDVMPFIELLTQ